MYGRQVGEQELNFEASGALRDAALIMRDRETDSWWSIMTSDAIGGDLDGTDLRELPYGEKTTWGDWKGRHPETLVLSVDGTEHLENNPYDNYFTSAGTFRDIGLADDRLDAKENIYTFWLEGRPFAVTHRAIEGGKTYRLDGLDERVAFFHRVPGLPMYASSEAWLVGAGATGMAGDEILAAIRAGTLEGAERLTGFDTFWYTWVAVNRDTELLD